MARYLVVAHQTASSPELMKAVLGIVKQERAVEFTLVVPATPPGGTLMWTEGEARALAQERMDAAVIAMTEVGAKVTRAVVGDSSPIDAIEDELRARFDYSGIVIWTLPHGRSIWLRRDLPATAQRRFGLPVVHVVADVAPEEPRADWLPSHDRRSRLHERRRAARNREAGHERRLPDQRFASGRPLAFHRAGLGLGAPSCAAVD